MAEKKQNKREKFRLFWKSTIVRIVVVVIVLVLPINIVTLVLSSMAVRNNREQLTKEMTNSMDAKMDVLSDMMNRAVKRIAYLNQDDKDFVSLADGRVQAYSEQVQYMTEINRTLDDVKMEYPWVDLIYFHYPDKNIFLTCGFPGINKSTYKECIENNVRGKSTAVWDIYDLDGTPVLLSSSQWNNTHFGVMINLERLLTKMNWKSPENGRVIFFSNLEESLMTKKGYDCFEEQGLSLEEMRNSVKYEVIEITMEEYGLKVVEVIQWSKESGLLSTSIILMISISVILTLLVIPLLLVYIHAAVSRPLHQLTRAIRKVEQGDMEYRIDAQNTKSREFEMINQNFNTMMDEVRHLKIDMYEQELEKKDIRMRYLSQQIKPHFIMNAMNIIYSYEPEEYPLIQKMVMCISKYFRYIVKMNDRFVELYQEMDHIKNYFEIQKARYPDMFFSIVEYDDRLKHALIPPLIIQNFAENAIKYSLKVGQKVTILLIVEYLEKTEKDERPFMRVRIADTGEGIPDSALEAIQRFKETGIHQKNLGVGTENSIERLKYLYDGEKTSIRFWRDEVYGGTNVDIVLPVYYAEEGVVYDENFISR